MNGHNIFISGHGGSGKSFLAKEIFKTLSSIGKKVAIICSTASKYLTKSGLVLHCLVFLVASADIRIEIYKVGVHIECTCRYIQKAKSDVYTRAIVTSVIA